MSGGKFLKECQVRDKIIGWIFFQCTFNLLWMTHTQEITHRVLKFHEWIGRDVYEWGKVFLRNYKWEIKLLGEFFPIHIQPFMNDSHSRNNNL